MKYYSNYIQKARQSQSKTVDYLPLVDNLAESKEPPSYELQIVASPFETRIRGNEICNLIVPQYGIKFNAPLTYKEASYILEVTRYWDFEPDRGRPRCLEKLRSLINSIVEGGDR